MPPTSEQRAHVEKKWPELIALADMLEHLTGTHAVTGGSTAAGGQIDGQEIVRLIRLYENASGASWRS